MSVALNAVLPVFLLAVMGYVLFRVGFINAEFSRGLNRLVYWIGLPCLLYHKIAGQVLDWSSVGAVLVAFFFALGCTILVAYIAGYFLKVEKNSTGAFVQAAYRGNLGFIGLPIVLYAATGNVLEQTSSLAALALAPCAIVFNIIAVTLMILHQPDSDGKRPGYLSSFGTNPLIIGGTLGVCAALFQWQLPLFLDRSIEGLSNMSVPVALLGLGSAFGIFGIRDVDRNFVVAASTATFLKVLISPLFGILFSLLFQLDHVEARIVTIYLATPTAIASHVIVGQFRGDEKLAASAIVSATLASILFLPLALWCTSEQTWSNILSLF